MDYFDTFANHIIDTEFYAQGKENQTRNNLEELKRNLYGTILGYATIPSKSIYNEAISICKQRIDDFFKTYKQKLKKDVEEQSKKESQFLKNLLKVALGVAIGAYFSLNKVLLAPFNSIDNFDSFITSLKSSFYKATTRPIMNAYVFGSSTYSTTKDFEDTTANIIQTASSNVHTLFTSVQRTTQDIMLLDLKNIRFQFISMLDEKTCKVCGAYSGQIFNSLQNAPKLPIHNRCRCYYLPITDTGSENPSYSEWFSKQPDSTQFKILGKTRYSLYKSGIDISRFSSDGHSLTLEELFNSIN